MKPNIGILTIPIRESGNIPLSHLVEIFYFLSDKLYLITGNDGLKFFSGDKRIQTYGIYFEKGINIFTRILKYIYMELKLSYQLLKIIKKVDIWIFFIGGDTIMLPMLTAKLFRKKVVLVFVGSSVQTHKSAGDNLFKLLEISSKINCTLSNRIILYSKNLINEFNLGKYKKKIYIAHEHYLDFNKFKIKKRYDDRDNLVGYIGRLSEEKGVFNLIKAISQLLKIRNDIKFIFIGDGDAREKIEKYLIENKLHNKVIMKGWILNEKLPDYFNELKLIVLPSYTEGLPNVLLEAMACGTPVLTTSVGAIPDITKDGETGFLMENNSPECIVANIQRALNHPALPAITDCAKNLVNNDFTFEAAVERFTKIFGEI